MKILELRASNVKNIKAVEIKTGGKAVTLTGKNGAGKSAVIDTILLALGGGKMSESIRNGETKAEAYIDLGEYQVKKVSTASGDRLEVKSGNMVAKSPQALLNNLLGQLTFDPLAYLGLDEKKQREILLKLIGVDLTDYEALRKVVFDERTVANREVKRLEGVLSELDVPHDNTPAEEMSAKKVMDELIVLQETARKHEESVFLDEQQTSNYEGHKERVEELIETLEHDLKTAQDELRGMVLPDRVLAPAVPDGAIEAKQLEATQVEGLNKIIRLANAYRGAKEDEVAAVKIADGLTDKINALDAKKEAALSTCEMPIGGLAVDEEGITMNGVRIKKLSTGEQIRVSVAIAMALNPKLKVILVREGSLLDEDGLKAIYELVEGKGYQLWIEKVDGSGECGVYIEAGEVKNG